MFINQLFTTHRLTLRSNFNKYQFTHLYFTYSHFCINRAPPFDWIAPSVAREYLNSFDFDHLYPSTARESPPSIIISDKCVVKKIPGVPYVARPEVREDGSNYYA